MDGNHTKPIIAADAEPRRASEQHEPSQVNGAACTADALPVLGVLTLGIGVGALSGPTLQGLGIWLFVVGCVVHGWGLARRNLADGSQGGRGRQLAKVIDVVSWAAIAVLAVLVVLTAGRAV